jgi:hypothetical protein
MVAEAAVREPWEETQRAQRADLVLPVWHRLLLALPSLMQAVVVAVDELPLVQVAQEAAALEHRAMEQMLCPVLLIQAVAVAVALKLE